MAMMQGRNPVEFDAAAHTLLANNVTHSDTRTVNTAVTTDRLYAGAAGVGGAYWDNPSQVPMGLFWVNVNITANAINGGGDTCDFTLEAHTSSDFGSARTELGRVKLTDSVANGLVGLYRFAVDAHTAKKLIAEATHLCLVNNLSDAVASVTYTAWLSFAKAS